MNFKKKFKYKRFTGILSSLVILSLLLAAVISTPVMAASISLSPTSGEAGDTITVTGDGFTSGHNINISFNGVDKAYPTVAPTGSISATFTVPSGLSAGTYQVRAFDWDTSTYVASATFTLISASISIDPEEGPVGTKVEIDGEDFDSNETITVEYDGDEVKITSTTKKANSSGNFNNITFSVPKSTAGEHTITAIGDSSDKEATAEFTVEPQIAVDPTSGTAGATINLVGTGFGDGVPITVYLNNNALNAGGDRETKSDGSFTAPFIVPSIAPGTYKVKVEDDDGNEHEVDFTITARIVAEVTSGNVGTDIKVSGQGFKATGTITITYDKTQITTVQTDSKGAFSTSFKAPASTHGNHTVTVTDGTISKEFTFTMESQAPPAPSLALPLPTPAAKQPITFDWADVNDASLPVKYNLEVATSSDFNAGSVVLKKEGLTTSTFTVPETQKLQSLKKGNSYYWRVKAIDAASNESAWTNAGTFTVKAGFSLPTWALYTVFALGAILLGLIGFILGRRSGGAY